jgi:hypothetical protein
MYYVEWDHFRHNDPKVGNRGSPFLRCVLSCFLHSQSSMWWTSFFSLMAVAWGARSEVVVIGNNSRPEEKGPIATGNLIKISEQLARGKETPGRVELKRRDHSRAVGRPWGISGGDSSCKRPRHEKGQREEHASEMKSVKERSRKMNRKQPKSLTP